jgi:hypothetical protein
MEAIHVEKGPPLGWGGIEYLSPYATAGRIRRPEGAARDHIECAEVLEDCLYDDAPYMWPHGWRIVPHRLKN